MKAIIEVRFEVEGNQTFPDEDIKKAIEMNLHLSNPPIANRTKQGNVNVRIQEMNVVAVHQNKDADLRG